MNNDATSSSNALNSRLKRPELVEKLVDFTTDLQFQDLPEDIVKTASLFIMDTVAVGVAATTYHATDKALVAAQMWGEGQQSRVIGRPDVKVSAAAAAFVNGMQVHALEWDGLHEQTVVIALCATTGALMAEVDRTEVSGEELIAAFVAGVEVAVFFGGVTTSSPRFFRPSVAGQAKQVAKHCRSWACLQPIMWNHASTLGRFNGASYAGWLSFSKCTFFS